MLKRGDVWLATLDPTVGREIRKTRPCLVVSPDELNRKFSTATVAPLTSGSRPAPFRISVIFEGVPGLILTEQLRLLDRRRFIKRLGELREDELRTVLATLRALFAD